MADITAAAVKSLRERTGLPLMKCKEALQKTGGDADAAVELIRKEGIKTSAIQSDRETSCGRIATHADLQTGLGAMIELQCESQPVANNEEFVQLAKDLVKQLATGPGAATPDELFGQPSPSKAGMTLREQMNDLTLRIREVFRLPRILRVNGACGGYAHFNGSTAALVEVTGGNQQLANEVAMHITAQKPTVVNVADLDQADVAKERDILSTAARGEGKPEQFIAKMVDGRMKNYYAEKVLTEQPFVKDDKQTVGAMAKAANMQIVRFHRWRLGG